MIQGCTINTSATHTTEVHTMKTTRTATGQYSVTGYTKADELVQYEITKNGHAWMVELVYGKGEDFKMLYATKAEAIEAIKNQG